MKFIYAITIMVIAAIAMPSLATVTQAASSVVDVSLPVNLASEVGARVSIPVTVSDVSGKGILGYKIIVRYNSALLRLSSASTAGTLSQSMQFATSSKSGEFTVAAFGNALSGSGKLIVLSGEVLKGGTIPLVIRFALFNEGNPQARIHNGSLAARLRRVSNVSPSVSTPPIAIISPNGRERWQSGSRQTIRWRGGTSSQLINILLLNPAKNQTIINIASAVANDGSEAWTIPVTVPAGQYYVRVISPGATTIMDDSNAPFNIAAPLPPPRRTLGVYKSGTGKGNIVSASDQGINCGADCSETFTSAPAVTLYAQPDSGSTLTRWSGCNSVSGTTCVVFMSANRRVTATFSRTAARPSINVSPTSLNFSAQRNGTTSAQAIALDSPSGIYNSLRLGKSCSNGCNWLLPAPSFASPSGANPAALVRVNAGGLNAGTYRGSLMISGNFVGSPIAIPVTFTISSSPVAHVPPLTVLFPNYGGEWQIGSAQTIRWSGGASNQLINILLLNTAKNQAVINIASAITNDGSETWTIPATVPTGQYYARVISPGVTVDSFDDSDEPVSIAAVATTTSTDLPKSVSLSADPASGTPPLAVAFIGTLTNFPDCGNTIAWTWGDGTNESAAESCADVSDGEPIRVITRSHTYQASGNYNARLTVNGIMSNIAAVSVKSIISSTSSITVISPNGEEEWRQGSTQTIRWSGGASNQLINILLLNTAKNQAVINIASAITNDGSETWTIPATVPTGQYYARVISPGSTADLFDDSDGLFSIVTAAGGGGGCGTGATSLSLDAWGGIWLNQNASTDFNTRLDIRVVNGGLYVRPWSSCCDWGERAVAQTNAIANNTLSFDWTESFKTIRYTLTLLSATRLHAVSQTIYADGRPGYTRDEYFTQGTAAQVLLAKVKADILEGFSATFQKIIKFFQNWR